MRTRKTLLCLFALCACLLVPANALGAAKPAWKLTATSLPTNFASGAEGTLNAGPEYLIIATNVGGAPTSGQIEIEDTLPVGLTPLQANPSGYGILGGSCEITGQTVACTYPKPIKPGAHLRVSIPVKVEAPAGTVLDNEARVEEGGALPQAATTSTTVSAAIPSFDFLPGAEGFSAPLSEEDGSATTQAGSHPYQLSVDFTFPTESPGALTSAGHVRDVIVDLPPGEIVNPRATPKCTEAQFESGTGIGNLCPVGSQIGIVTAAIPLTETNTIISELYNMVPPPGSPSVFAFDAANANIYIHVFGAVRSDGDYGLSGVTNDILARPLNPLLNVQVQFWGDPAGESHDLIRGAACRSGLEGNSCPNEEGTGLSLLTNPVQCPGQPTVTKARADSWEELGLFKEASYESADLGGTPVNTGGCNQLEFEPTIEAKPTTNLADSPSGLDFKLHQPTDETLAGVSPAIMRDITLTLPQGLTVNPSSADGLATCSEADANVHSLSPSECPNAAKLASAEVISPLVEDLVVGSLYLAKPYANPFGSLLALYLAVDDPKTGIVANLAGKVTTDPVTGQLTTRFEENPQLPIEDIKLHLFTGPRASLRTPPTCGTYSTTSDITPWSAPETANAHPSDSFAITSAPAGRACPSSVDQAPNSPSFSAGTIAPQAGAYSPFVLKVKREDATQPLAGIEATLPPGLTGKLAGVSYCSEAQIALAQGRNKPNEGALEKANPSCPSSSEVGEVDVAAGAGITPLHVTGHAYLAGPYKGAPLSLVIITPAIAGPFDLGAVTVRTALNLDPETAQIHAVSDPLPQILEGIPLDVRSVAVTMGRPDFTLNPTSCDPMQVQGKVSSALGQSSSLTSPFQVGGCSALAFKPKLSIRLKGQTKRTGHPALTAVASFRVGDANTKFAQVTLPRSEFLDQAHIGTVCTRVQFKADQCPAASIYGEAEASSPLLDQPLEGLAYLRSSDHELPDLVIALKGQVDVVLAGRIDSVNGGIRTTFEAAPDAPVSKFILRMRGGKKGLLINSANLCKLKPVQTKATMKMEGQNGKVNDFQPVVKSSCGKAKRKKGHRRGGHKKQAR
jgi:hypothetical protein